MPNQYHSQASAKNYSEALGTAKTEWQAGYPAVLSQIKPSSTVLDYGCGSGGFATKLVANKCKVVGVDTSESMLLIANKNISGATFINISNGVPPDWINRFDYVTANFVLCTLDEGALKGALEIIYDVLKPGGALLVLHSNWDKSNGNEFESFILNKKENLRNHDKVLVTLKSNQAITLEDYFRDIQTYVDLFKVHGLSVENVEEPVAETLNGKGSCPAFYVIMATKE